MQQEYNAKTNEVTIWVDGNELRIMEQCCQRVYHTPGSSEVYVASQPSFMYDYGVASPSDFLETVGYDFSDGCNDQDIFELTVTLEDD